jgi:hypothetical protein
MMLKHGPLRREKIELQATNMMLFRSPGRKKKVELDMKFLRRDLVIKCANKYKKLN